jgi:succinate dehydrogenase/fumarate reductase-like Fe-S protein
MNLTLTDFNEDEEGTITASIVLDREANEVLVNKAISSILEEAVVKPQPNTVELDAEQVEPLVTNYLKNLYLDMEPWSEDAEDIKSYEERKAACQVILRYIMMPSDINKFFDGIKYGNA